MKKTTYIAPEAKVVEIKSAAILAASNKNITGLADFGGFAGEAEDGDEAE